MTGARRVLPVSAFIGAVVATLLVTGVASRAMADEVGLESFLNNIGIAQDPISGADFDGVGFSYSALALRVAGVEPGGTVTADGFEFTWPDKPSGGADNVASFGQTVPVTVPAGATRVGILTAANHGPTPANVVLNYTFVDEFGVTQTSKETVPVVVSDWTLNGGGQQPAAGNTIAITTPFRMLQSAAPEPTKAYVFVVSVPIDTTKTLVSVKLPLGTSGQVHVFGMATK
jgi:hypothetical protein